MVSRLQHHQICWVLHYAVDQVAERALVGVVVPAAVHAVAGRERLPQVPRGEPDLPYFVCLHPAQVWDGLGRTTTDTRQLQFVACTLFTAAHTSSTFGPVSANGAVV